MKTKTFITQRIPEKFVNDIQKLDDLPFDFFKNASEIYIKMRIEDSKEDDRKEYSNLLSLVQSEKIAITDVAEALAVGLFFVNESFDNDDSIEDIVDDIVRLNTTLAKDGLIKKLNYLKDEYQEEYRAYIIRRDAIVSNTPTLASIHTRISTNHSFSPSFNIYDDNLENYNPKLSASIPLANIHLTISKFGEEEKVHFAVTEKRLKEIIKTLELTKIELINLPNNIKYIE